MADIQNFTFGETRREWSGRRNEQEFLTRAEREKNIIDVDSIDFLH